jgi:hypothetical protein
MNPESHLHETRNVVHDDAPLGSIARRTFVCVAVKHRIDPVLIEYLGQSRCPEKGEDLLGFSFEIVTRSAESSQLSSMGTQPLATEKMRSSR